jgi:hypothetical protein
MSEFMDGINYLKRELMLQLYAGNYLVYTDIKKVNQLCDDIIDDVQTKEAIKQEATNGR